MPNVIFTVTTLTENRRRTPAWFAHQENAVACIENNRGDIHETDYTYAVIEKIEPGLYSLGDRDEQWFEWKGDRYIRCEKPDAFHGVYGFAIG